MAALMDIGMLWLDDSKSSLEEKVQRAAAYYRKKYGRHPNLCFVNAGSLADKTQVAQIEIRPAKNILPSHLWLGVGPANQETADVNEALP